MKEDPAYRGLNEDGPHFLRQKLDPPADWPSHVVAAARRAFWIDHDWFAAHPDADEYVRPRIPFEFGPGDDALLDPDFDMKELVRWVLVNRMGDGHGLAWIRTPLQLARVEVERSGWSGARADFWEFQAGRPDDL